MIVGPARTVVGSNQKPFIDSFDVVVRMNNVNRYYPFVEGLANDIGARLDLYYTHGLLIKRQVEKYGEFVWPEGATVRMCSHVLYKGRLNETIGSPTTVGMSAIWDLCLHNIKNLYVTGFTFCLNGPNDHIFYQRHHPLYNPKTKHNYPAEATLFGQLYKMPFLQIGCDERLGNITRVL